VQRDRIALLRHGDKTQKLLGLIFRVRNELKAGWSEDVYHQALLKLCETEGVPVISKPRMVMLHRGTEIHIFEPDLIVWDLIILELKALAYQTQFAGDQYAQLIHYLKYYNKDLGLLINFAPKRVQTKRILWDEPVVNIYEEYERIMPLLSEQDRPPLHQFRECILTIGQQYGLGYPESVYRKLILVEAMSCGVKCVEEVEIPALWNGKQIAQQKTQHILVENKFLIHLRSLLDYPTEYDFTRLKTYMASLHLSIGLVINFGRDQLQIYGVSVK
jgi:GxxExxY protein